MSCKCSKFDEDLGRYVCNITDSECIYYIPNSKRCAEEYGEGPDVESEGENNE
jgi:hypothetical protein